MASTSTFKNVLRDVARDLWRDRHPLDITATGGSTSTVVSSAHAYSSAPANAYDGVYIYVATDTGGVAPEGEISRVTTGGFAGSTGTWTVSPAFTADVASGDTVFFLYGFDRTTILNAVNRVLAQLYMPAYTILTLVDDGNMEDSTVTNWADVVGTPTQTKDTTAGRVLIGTQSLKIVTTNLGDGVTSNTVRVHEGETLHVSVPVMCDAGSLTVQLYDVTNSTAVRSVTVNEEDWAEVRFQEAVPDGCEEVTIRLLSATASTTAYVGWVALTSSQRDVYTIPSQITDTQWINGIYYLPQGYSSEVADSYIALSHQLVPLPLYDAMRDWRAEVSQRIVIDTSLIAPIFLKYMRTGPAISTDSSLVYAPSEVLVEGALAELKLALADRAGANTDAYRRWRGEAAQNARTYHRLVDSLGLGKPQVRYVGQSTRRVGYRIY